MSDAYAAIGNPAVDMSESSVKPGFDAQSWDMVGSLNLSLQLPTGSVLIELADAGHDEIVVCTADLGRPTQVINFGRRFPERYFNFGIAERNMIGAAAGLATTGLLPVISNYSFFLALMGAENIRNDIAYPGLKVRMVGTHSGLAMGFYGTSHHCNEDIGLLRAIAGLTVMAPCDANAIRLFPNNQLGSDTDQITQVRTGGLDFLNVAASVLSTVVPRRGARQRRLRLRQLRRGLARRGRPARPVHPGPDGARGRGAAR
ncbi:MAG: hypothetical protein M3Y41_00820, partial [Pseudomonadota bacterium]|nr:hypothetical protein [Pseudomonadota bacterium]